MHHTSLNKVFYVTFDNKWLGPGMPEGRTKAILHGVYGREGQPLLTHLLLETGAHWSGIPLVALSTGESPPQIYAWRQPWGCMGDEPIVSHLPFLEGLKVETKHCFGRHTGIIIDWNGAFAAHPQEHKPLSLILDEDGGFLLLPNNYMTHVEDLHFTRNDIGMKKFYRRGEATWWEGQVPLPPITQNDTGDTQ